MSGYRPNIFGKAMAIDGDKTTTGATCIASSSMIKYKGTPAVIVGDLTTPCPQCKQTGTDRCCPSGTAPGYTVTVTMTTATSAAQSCRTGSH